MAANGSDDDQMLLAWPPRSPFSFNDQERDGAITVLQMVNAGAGEVCARLIVCDLES